MKKERKKDVFLGIVLLLAFVVWTFLIQAVDVQTVGVCGTDIGFATFNKWFHEITRVHMSLYYITDWLGLVPLFVCMFFGGVGLVQLIKRKSLFKVDYDIILLGVYYGIVIAGYLIFEMIPINYRPILIDGVLEASYPSSTTLLVLGVMPTLVFHANRRIKNVGVKMVVSILSVLFSAFMVIGRLLSGVHWFTDIVGAVLLSAGLFYIYKATVLLYEKERTL